MSFSGVITLDGSVSSISHAPPLIVCSARYARHGCITPHSRSKIPAAPMPPPTHIVTMPYREPCAGAFREISVAVSLAPVQPSGWPSAIAPPLTFSRSGSIGSSFRQASTCAAKASFSSIEIDLIERQPGLLERFLDRRHRPMPKSSGRDARGRVADESRQRRQAVRLGAASAEVTITAAAPSLVCDELPAVTVPAT